MSNLQLLVDLREEAREKMRAANLAALESQQRKTEEGWANLVSTIRAAVPQLAPYIQWGELREEYADGVTDLEVIVKVPNHLDITMSWGYTSGEGWRSYGWKDVFAIDHLLTNATCPARAYYRVIRDGAAQYAITLGGALVVAQMTPQELAESDWRFNQPCTNKPVQYPSRVPF